MSKKKIFNENSSAAKYFLFFIFSSEWQDIFYTIHSVCLWDEKGSFKIRDSLEELLEKFIKQAQKRVLIAGEEQALLHAYIIEWRKFFTQSSYLPLPFWQIESSLQVYYDLKITVF